MLSSATSIILLVAALLPFAVYGQPTPLTPPAGKVGANCQIVWTPDTTGKWTETNIELMTGSNPAMVHVTTVATLDTTTANAAATFSYPCPNVTPNSDIYWYQFSSAVDPTNLIWTIRFPIASSTGTTTPPEHPLQVDGTAVPWGTGYLVDPSQAKPAPAYVTGETSESGSGNSTVATSSIASVSMVTTTTMTMSMSSMTTSVATTKSASGSSSASASASSSAPSATTTSGAMAFGPKSLAGLAATCMTLLAFITL